MLTIASDTITADHALTHLREYANVLPAMVRYYDYAGNLDHAPEPADCVDMVDIARLVVINAQLTANDVPALLEPVAPRLWDDVPRGARFEDLPDNPLSDKTYRALVALYDAYGSRRGLKQAKVTKLLHLKRPHLVAVIDSVAQRAYESNAKALAQEF